MRVASRAFWPLKSRKWCKIYQKGYNWQLRLSESSSSSGFAIHWQVPRRNPILTDGTKARITLHYAVDVQLRSTWGNSRLRQRESAGKEENVVEQRASRKATRTRAADGPSASKVDISPRWVTCKRCRINTTCRRFTQDTLAVLSAARRPPRHTHTPALKSLARRHRLAYFLQHRDSSCRR